MMEEKQNRVLGTVMAAILLVSMYFVAGEGASYVYSGGVEAKGAEDEETGKEKFCVVVDAGHGGADPGKVGAGGALEKDINLEIARLVKKFLESEGVRVVMTRTGDDGLYDAGASNKKVQDMKRRIAIIEEAEPEIVISIHQNSYHEEYVRGAQVFYYTGSATGKRLAEMIQEQFGTGGNPGNGRKAKANSSYYLLKRTPCPIVIVECGFLSNREEEKRLQTKLYQEKAAWAVHMGVMQYLNSPR